MHAVVVRVNISNREEATSNLRERVVPGVKQLPGLVAGYWTQKDATGLSMVVFDSEENAASAAETVESRMPEGVQLESIEVREVVADA